MEENFLAAVVGRDKAEALILDHLFDCAKHAIFTSQNLWRRLELRSRTLYEKSIITRRRKMLKVVTLKEIERIFVVLDAMGISREAVVIPLRTEHPGRLTILKDGKLEIVVERDADFEDWVTGLQARIAELMKPEPD